MARSRAVVELRHRRRLLEKGWPHEEIERRVTKYMKEYDLKEHHREIYLAGKSSYEKQKANALFEIWWSGARKELLDEG